MKLDRCPLPLLSHQETLNPTPVLKPKTEMVKFEIIKRRGKKVVPPPPNVEEIVEFYRNYCMENSSKKPRKASVNKWFRETGYIKEELEKVCSEHCEAYPK